MLFRSGGNQQNVSGRPVTWAGVYAEKAEGTGLHSFPVSATISAVKKRRKETVATERIQRESGR